MTSIAQFFMYMYNETIDYYSIETYYNFNFKLCDLKLRATNLSTSASDCLDIKARSYVTIGYIQVYGVYNYTLLTCADEENPIDLKLIDRKPNHPMSHLPSFK